MRWSGSPAGCGDLTVVGIGFKGEKTRVDGEIVDAVNIFADGRSGPNPKLGEFVLQLLRDLDSARNRKEDEASLAPAD
jgi:ferredoxin-nitrite reductase